MSKKADKPSEELVNSIFTEQIKNRKLIPVANPAIVFVAGISGSGKSYSIKELKREDNNIFIIQPDKYRSLHPDIDNIIAKYGRKHANEYTGTFSNNMAIALRQKAIQSKFNVIYETTFSNINTAQTIISDFKGGGYSISVVALPIDVEKSLERNEQRYIEKLESHHSLPRRVSIDDIKRMGNNFSENINKIEELGITVYRVGKNDEIKAVVKKVVTENMTTSTVNNDVKQQEKPQQKESVSKQKI